MATVNVDVPRSTCTSYDVYISQLIRFALASNNVANCNKFLTQKLLKQGYQYQKIAKLFLNFIAFTMTDIQIPCQTYISLATGTFGATVLW